MPSPQTVTTYVRRSWFADRYAELDRKDSQMPSLAKLAEAFPEVQKESTPKLRDFDGKTVTIIDAKFLTRKVNDNDVTEPFIFLTGGVKVQATNSVVKQVERLFSMLDGEVKKGNRKALAAIGIPEDADLNKPETWRFLDCVVTAQNRGVKIG